MNRPSPAQVRDAVEQACRECDLDSQFIASVYAYVEQDEDEWPRCCGSSCEPCVQALEHAARRALILLERSTQSERPATENATNKVPSPSDRQPS
ncbi:MAG: hypothetical protein U0269_27085 [Polyangiales bacterium]